MYMVSDAEKQPKMWVMSRPETLQRSLADMAHGIGTTGDPAGQPKLPLHDRSRFSLRSVFIRCLCCFVYRLGPQSVLQPAP
jgi:hypothetical protein